MGNNDVLRRAVRCALFANVAAVAAVPVVNAQEAPAAANAGEEAPAISEVVVTGSRIQAPGLTSISPVEVISSEAIKQQGVTRIEDLLNTLPQVFADQGGNVSNGSTGEATVDLRGLGVQRTLVLINGRRLMPGDPTIGSASAPDLNNIPTALIERVDVLTGGASSTYGADAVAGVVNFVMNDHFEGLKIDGNLSEYQHSNHNSTMQATVTNSNDLLPSSSVNDGAAKDVTIIFGKNLADGAGNFTAYAGYRKIEPVLQANRDFAACTPDISQSSPTGFVCGGSSTSATGRFIPFFTNTPAGVASPNFTGDFTTNAAGNFVPWSAADKYNYAPTNYFQRPDQRWTAGEFLHLDLTDKMQIYNEFMFMQDTSVSQIAPGGAFIGQGTAITGTGPLAGVGAGLPNGAVQTNCANPFLSASQLAALCNGQTTGDAQFLLGRRDVEGGGRVNELDHTSFRIVIGLKGELAPGWKYDTYAMEGQTQYSNYGSGNFSKQNFTNAMDVITSPTTGQPICANAAAVGCVPYNVFKVGGVTPQALAYVDIPALLTGNTEERVVDGNITGDLGKNGVKFPWNEEGLIINVGSQYRSETALLHADVADTNDDIYGAGGPTKSLEAGFHVWEGYFEGGMPILQDKTFAKELSFETGYRYSSYDIGFNTNTYKFGLNWAPTSDLRFRGSYQRAVRAPNLQELFTQKVLALEGSADPCAGTGTPLNSSSNYPTSSLAACRHTGVTAAQYGKILPSPAGQYQGLTGGNPNLQPEQADTVSFGFVLTPQIVPNASVTIDYYNIRIKNVISSYGFPLQLTDCLNTGNSYFCGQVHRDAAGTLWASPLGYIDDPTLNLGALQNRGVDIGTNYKLDLAGAGKLAFSFVGTYTAQFITEPGGLLGIQSYNCAGYYGNTCGVPAPKFKSRFRVNYDTPLPGLALGMQWRHISHVLEDTNSPNPLLNGVVDGPFGHIASYDYLDLTASYEINKTISVRLGCNNVADKDPPLLSADYFAPPFVNGNTYPQVYDSLGRYLFANVTLTF